MAYVELVGTAKQVEWAEKIRYRLTEIIDRKIPPDPELLADRISGGWLPEFAQLCDSYEAQVEAVNRRTEARWWIENRQWFDSLSFPEKIGFVAGYFSSRAEMRDVCNNRGASLAP